MDSSLLPAVLITGGAHRLGLAFAKKSLSMGLATIIHYRSSLYDSESQLHDDIAQKRCYFLQSELTDTTFDLIDACAQLPVQLVGLVNNASLFTAGNLNDQPHFRAILENNLFTPTRLTQRFKEKIGRGWVINVTDAHICRPNSNFQNYRLSKLFFEEITRQQAFLYAPHIRVNAIAPGAMLPAVGKEESTFASLTEAIPLKRTGDLASLTAAYEFLVKNDYVTGQVLAVDGGWRITD